MKNNKQTIKIPTESEWKYLKKLGLLKEVKNLIEKQIIEQVYQILKYERKD